MVIDDENAIPLDFKTTRYEAVTVIDKDSMYDTMIRGENVDGAHLEERGYYLKTN